MMKPIPGKYRWLILLFCLSIWPNVSVGQQLKVDHIILVNPDLSAAIDEFIEKGFTIKKGRRHKNGLINAHIKFPDSSSIELMSLQGKPSDEMAKAYADLIKKGRSGAYLALSGLPVEKIVSKLKRLSLDYIISPGEHWTYISFPPESALAHIFFIIYHSVFTDEPEELIHPNGVTWVDRVSIEGDRNVIELMKSMTESTSLRPNDFVTANGLVRIISRDNFKDRPLIREVMFKLATGDSLKMQID